MAKLLVLGAVCVALSLYMGDASLEKVESLLAQLTTMAPLSDIKCPGSESLIHASCKTKAKVPGFSCAQVKEEMLARVAAQKTGKWQDPHNHGTYHVLDTSTQNELLLDRRTGNDKYTDKMLFSFEDSETGSKSCTIAACSESQVTSVADFSTNYCNLRNMYCGVTDQCPYVKYDLANGEELSVRPSMGAGTSKAACLG